MAEQLGLISLVLGLFATVASGLSWYQSKVKKEYAAERDFAHLRNGQIEASKLLARVADEIEALREDVDRIVWIATGKSIMPPESRPRDPDDD